MRMIFQTGEAVRLTKAQTRAHLERDPNNESLRIFHALIRRRAEIPGFMCISDDVAHAARIVYGAVIRHHPEAAVELTRVY